MVGVWFMKKAILILVAGLLLSGCAESGVDTCL